MNNEKYTKFKKDFIVLYLARNGIATLFITLMSFGFDISNYYHISFTSAIARTFNNSIFTTTYFLLMWVFNYLIFELYKIVVDYYRDHSSHKGMIYMRLKGNEIDICPVSTIIPAILIILTLFIPVANIFKLSAIMMFVFMILRSIKELIKNRL